MKKLNEFRTAPVAEYMKIRQYVVGLASRCCGEPMLLPTMNELAQMFGVARITVHKALKDLIRDNYLISRKGVGTFVNPAKLRSYKGAICIGIAIGDAKQSFSDLYFWLQISAIAEEATRHQGFAKLISLSSSSPEEMMAEAKNNIIDGLVWIAPEKSGEDTLRLMQRNRFPAVAYNLHVEGANSVAMDIERHAYETGLALLEEGRSNIVFATLQEDIPATALHLAGLKKAFKAKGLELNDGMILKNKDSVQTELEKILELGVDVQAIVVSYSRHLHPVMAALRKRNVDWKKHCRLVVDTMFIDDEPDFEGWVREYHFKEAAKDAVAMLNRMIEKQDFSVEARLRDLNVKQISRPGETPCAGTTPKEG